MILSPVYCSVSGTSICGSVCRSCSDMKSQRGPENHQNVGEFIHGTPVIGSYDALKKEFCTDVDSPPEKGDGIIRSYDALEKYPCPPGEMGYHEVV